MEAYRDIHNTNLTADIERINNSSMSDKQKEKINDFVTKLQIGKIGKRVKDKRVSSYLQFLLRLHNYFKKDLDTLTEKEIEDFSKVLMENKIKKQNGLPYSEATKDLFIRTLKRYLGYCWDKESSKYKKRIAWCKENYKKSNKQAIRLEQCNKIVDKESNTRNKCLFKVGFDSGGRIEEILNIRLKDMEKKKKQKGKGSYYLVHLRGTKTDLADRKIALPLAVKEINEWLKEYPVEDKNSYLFPITYDNARKIIRIMSKRLLEKHLAPHELRHSSATHYIQKFGAKNIGGFYYRYGWKFGSKEAEGYIKEHLFSGDLAQEKVSNLVESDRIEELMQRVKELEERDKEKDKILRRFNKAFKEMEKIK